MPDFWPIRVGGEYQSSTIEGLTMRVTEIDGETIHYGALYREEREPYRYSSEPAWMFRRRHAPEDASPIPALLAALRAFMSVAPDVDEAHRLGLEAMKAAGETL